MHTARWHVGNIPSRQQEKDRRARAMRAKRSTAPCREVRKWKQHALRGAQSAVWRTHTIGNARAAQHRTGAAENGGDPQTGGACTWLQAN
jgi:hypothetical protein